MQLILGLSITRDLFSRFFFFGHCVERTQERLITRLSFSKKGRAGYEGKPG